MRLVLGKTKTTGPDKMQKEVAVHIYRTTSLTGEDWLRSGFEIWESDEFRFRRDYMVMEPSAQGEAEVSVTSGPQLNHFEVAGDVASPQKGCVQLGAHASRSLAAGWS